MRFLDKFLTLNNRRRAAARPTSFRLQLERLEDRCLPTAGLTNVGELVMANAQTQKGLYDAVVDPTTNFAYFGTSHTGDVIKVNLNGALPVTIGDTSASGSLGRLESGVIDTSSTDPSQHYLYFCTQTGTILKLAPGDATHGPQLVASLTLTGLLPGYGVVSAAIDTSSSDPSQHFVYLGANPGSGAGGQVVRVRLSDFTEQGIETVNAPSILRSAVIDPVRHFLYFTSAPGFAPYVLKVDTASFPNGASSLLDLSSTTPGLGIARAGFATPTLAAAPVVDVADNRIYLGTETYDPSPGQVNNNIWPYNQSLIAEINPGTGDQFPANPVVGILNLQPGERDLSSVAYDQADGDLIYATDNTYAGMVIRVHVGNGAQPMQEVGSIRLQFGIYTPVPQDGTSAPDSDASGFGESFLVSGFFDPADNAAFFGTDTYPGQVIKIGVAPSGPSAPTTPSGLTLAPGSDSGASASDDITNVVSPTITGHAQVGVTVTLYDGTTSLGTTTADGNGNWSLAVGPLNAGSHSLTATASNSIGTSAASAVLAVTIDTTPPIAPQFDLDPNSDTAPLGDHATTLATVTLTGQTEAGASVTLQQTGATVVADATGTFHFTNVALAIGANLLNAQATDLAGNASSFSITITRQAVQNPQAHKIVFESTRDGNYEIYTMYADGSSPTDLTNNPAADEEPAFTRDGTKIAFVSNRNGNFDIWTMNPDGTGLKQLTSNAGMNLDPIFSDDDSKIAFESNRTGTLQIYVMNADGSNQIQLTNLAGSSGMPSFNQNGSALIFASTASNPSSGNEQLYTINVNGTNLTRLTTDSASDFYARYSPDGSHIAFESTRSGATEIYTMNADGSNQVMLTHDATGDTYPSYSPDGSQIDFTSSRDGNAEIYIMNADGTGQTRLTNNPARDMDASWDDVPSSSAQPAPATSKASLAKPAIGGNAWTELGEASIDEVFALLKPAFGKHSA